jgi:hypothetical protein
LIGPSAHTTTLPYQKMVSAKVSKGGDANFAGARGDLLDLSADQEKQKNYKMTKI